MDWYNNKCSGDNRLIESNYRLQSEIDDLSKDNMQNSIATALVSFVAGCITTYLACLFLMGI